MEWMTSLLSKYPELGVYLALGIGYCVGERKVFGISTSIGALLAGIATGHMRANRSLFGRVPDGAINFMTA